MLPPSGSFNVLTLRGEAFSLREKVAAAG